MIEQNDAVCYNCRAKIGQRLSGYASTISIRDSTFDQSIPWICRTIHTRKLAKRCVAAGSMTGNPGDSILWKIR